MTDAFSEVHIITLRKRSWLFANPILELSWKMRKQAKYFLRIIQTKSADKDYFTNYGLELAGLANMLAILHLSNFYRNKYMQNDKHICKIFAEWRQEKNKIKRSLRGKGKLTSATFKYPKNHAFHLVVKPQFQEPVVIYCAKAIYFHVGVFTIKFIPPLTSFKQCNSSSVLSPIKMMPPFSGDNLVKTILLCATGTKWHHSGKMTKIWFNYTDDHKDIFYYL